ncbi:histidine phosphatase family protein [Paracoccus sp. (in: a-proteobacteria)]|uniref:histidine phosphatase family protein n=1 Tax=Paracoccus sp. TaxID=267 RepID=UPI0028A1DB4E|nr:histidine phosphatase family protein [Paracoccus sp. (in: a-proteobacteria)]
MRGDVTKFPDLYLMRHGQTIWNVEERMQGLLDSPLTELGLGHAQRQAALVSALAQKQEIDLAAVGKFASTQGRAQHTAQIIFGDGGFESDQRLVEIDVGAFTGAQIKHLRISHPHIFTGPRYDWYNRTPDGEHFAALEARVRSFLEGLTSPAMIVTHGMTLRMIRVVALGLPVARIAEMPVRQGVIHLVAQGRHRTLS